MAFSLLWMFCYYVLFRTSDADLSCSANNACSSLRTVNCGFYKLGPYQQPFGVKTFTKKSIPSSPECHNITVARHQNTVLLNITWSGPDDGSVSFLQGFLLSAMSSSTYPLGRYLIDLKKNVRLFKNETLFNTIRRGVFSVVCNYTDFLNEGLNFHITSLPYSEERDSDVNECLSTFYPDPLVTSVMSKQEVDKKLNVEAILAASAVVCFSFVVVITLVLWWRRRRKTIHSNSEIESESGPSAMSVPSVCVSVKRVAPNSGDSLIGFERRKRQVNTFTGLSSGQSEASSGESMFDEDIIQDMLRINFPDKTDNHGHVSLVEQYV